MAINKTEKQELLEKLNVLLKKQSLFQQEINNLESQIVELKVIDTENGLSGKKEPEKFEYAKTATPVKKSVHKLLEQREIDDKKPKISEKIKNPFGSEMEKFIGENLINKIGIAVLIIGVGIGAKYAIDNDLISPLVRIILGYCIWIRIIIFCHST